jgi:5-formyltetrahydrofolate cyclo-ligase
MCDILVKKRFLRKRVRKAVSALTKKEKILEEKKIHEKFFRLAPVKKAKVIMFFIATHTEVSTKTLIKEALQQGKIVAAPRIQMKTGDLLPIEIRSYAKDLVRGPYGIMQPRYVPSRVVDIGAIDVVVVPGVAFTKRGLRLGRGKGYFDRFLVKLSSRTHRIALAFKSQIVRTLPHLAHDIAVHTVVTA